MTQEEWESYLKQVFPDEILGFIRPGEGIPDDLGFSTNFPQFISKDPVYHLKINAFLRQLFSNDKQCREWIDELVDAFDKQDFNLATQKMKGLMSAADKLKLDGVAAGAEVNQNTFSNIKAGAQTVAATTKTDTAEFAAGSNIAISANGKKITVGVTGIANGAEVNQNAFSAVQVGTTKINAAAKADTVTIAAGKNISIIPDTANKKITIQVDGELGLNFLKRNTAYIVGDIAESPDLPSWSQLECITAGTTAVIELSVAVTKIGQKITDGTVQWVLRHKGEMHNVGDIWMTKAAFNSAGFLIHATTGLPMLDVHLCDGTNGTINMTNRFPMGTNVAANIGTTGGANSKVITAAQMPVHAHGASAWTDAQGNHAHVEGSTPEFGVSGVASTGHASNSGCVATGKRYITDAAGAHGHNIGISIANAGGNAAFDVRPAYTAVAFVQKIY